MDHKKDVFQELLPATAGVLLCSGVMVGVYALIGKFSMNVVLSALGGSAVIILNYLCLALTVTLATRKAEQGDTKGAQNMISLSSLLRLLLMGAMLFGGIKLGGNVIALVLPLVFLRPVLMVSGLMRKKGGK